MAINEKTVEEQPVESKNPELTDKDRKALEKARRDLLAEITGRR